VQVRVSNRGGNASASAAAARPASAQRQSQSPSIATANETVSMGSASTSSIGSGSGQFSFCVVKLPTRHMECKIGWSTTRASAQGSSSALAALVSTGVTCTNVDVCTDSTSGHSGYPVMHSSTSNTSTKQGGGTVPGGMPEKPTEQQQQPGSFAEKQSQPWSTGAGFYRSGIKLALVCVV